MHIIIIADHNPEVQKFYFMHTPTFNFQKEGEENISLKKRKSCLDSRKTSLESLFKLVLINWWGFNWHKFQHLFQRTTQFWKKNFFLDLFRACFSWRFERQTEKQQHIKPSKTQEKKNDNENQGIFLVFPIKLIVSRQPWILIKS